MAGNFRGVLINFVVDLAVTKFNFHSRKLMTFGCDGAWQSRRLILKAYLDFSQL